MGRGESNLLYGEALLPDIGTEDDVLISNLSNTDDFNKNTSINEMIKDTPRLFKSFMDNADGILTQEIQHSSYPNEILISMSKTLWDSNSPTKKEYRAALLYDVKEKVFEGRTFYGPGNAPLSRVGASIRPVSFNLDSTKGHPDIENYIDSHISLTLKKIEAALHKKIIGRSSSSIYTIKDLKNGQGDRLIADLDGVKKEMALLLRGFFLNKNIG